jgi:hypothetical protein
MELAHIAKCIIVSRMQLARLADYIEFIDDQSVKRVIR